MIAAIFKSTDFQKRLLWLNGAIPAVLLGLDWARGNLGANPPEALIRTTGVMAILFLAFSLCVTPLSKMFHWSWAIRHRRWLGLWSFYYALLHFMGYALFDKDLVFLDILVDIKKRPFILLGFCAFLLMLPLAITSTNDMVRRLGAKRWKNLHKLSYLIAIVAAVHYWMIVKSDLFYPASFAGAFALLLLYRLKR